jgi:hypothetical protein
MIVVIGADWLNSRDSKGQRRLDDPKDFVRLEIEAAFKRDIRVIPVLFDSAEMPQAEALPSSISPLTERQAIKFHHTSFPRDIEYLNSALAKVVASTKQPGGPWEATISSRSRTYVSIEFWQSNEHHRLEIDTGGWINKMLLDGVRLRFKEVTNFKIKSHANQFQLRFHKTWTDTLKNIKLWVDNRLILEAE